MIKRRVILQFFLFVLGLFPLSSSAHVKQISQIALLSVSSVITPATLDYIKESFSRFPTDTLAVLKLDTPGGLVQVTKEIIKVIGNSPHPTVIWITPEGAEVSSAGVLVASAADFILMSPGTSIGAATPISLTFDFTNQDEHKKAISELFALVRSLCEAHQRPSRAFELMIFNTSSFTDEEAKRLKLSDGIVSTNNELRTLLHQKPFVFKSEDTVLDLSRAEFKEYPQSTGQEILSVLTHPTIAYFLFLLGVALIIFELQVPGGQVAGGIGTICILLAAIAFETLPLHWGAFGLILVGIILLVLEIYVTSYGLLGLSGLTAFTAGSLFLFHGSDGLINTNLSLLLSMLLGISLASIVIIWFFIRHHKGQEKQYFFLPLDSEGTVLNKKEDSSYFQIKVKGEIWNATSDDEVLTSDRVKVTAVDSKKLILHVKKIVSEE